MRLVCISTILLDRNKDDLKIVEVNVLPQQV